MKFSWFFHLCVFSFFFDRYLYLYTGIDVKIVYKVIVVAVGFFLFCFLHIISPSLLILFDIEHGCPFFNSLFCVYNSKVYVCWKCEETEEIFPFFLQFILSASPFWFPFFLPLYLFAIYLFIYFFQTCWWSHTRSYLSIRFVCILSHSTPHLLFFCVDIT